MRRDEADSRGFLRIAITGTRWLTESEVYPEKFSGRALGYMRPGLAEREEINRIIMDELVYGVFKPEAVAYLQKVIERMKIEGCDAVVLGCTELPLIMNDGNSPLPTLDSTRLLARAAIHRAIEGSKAKADLGTLPSTVRRLAGRCAPAALTRQAPRDRVAPSPTPRARPRRSARAWPTALLPPAGCLPRC